MHLSKISFSIVWILLLFISNAAAAGPDESPNAPFKHGVQAFSKGEYEKAVKYFNAARKAGLDTPALHYNLGVSYFKLKRYTEAQSEFKQLTKEADLAPLSHYNLGLIALRRGDKPAAAQHFQTTFRTAKDKKLRMLAGAQLKDIPPPPKRRMWSGFFSFAAGYDDNVTLNVDDEVKVSDTKDEFVELIVNLEH
jgi:tetratricopeptide (TPR) repeat protein